MKRRDREAREAEQHAESARLWWEHEKRHAERMRTQFRANKARAEGARTVRRLRVAPRLVRDACRV